MSWIDKIQKDLVITTGDGKTYTPLYFNASVSKQKDFNISKFEFPHVKGSLVIRRQPMGVQYDIEIMFQGANNLDVSDEFSDSADDPNAWGIFHPIYGEMVVQPIGLKFDNSAFNVTTITGTIIETIDSSALIPASSAPDKVASKATTTNVKLAATYSTDIPSPTVSDITGIRNNINTFFNSIKAKISVTSDYEQIFNTYNQINGLLNNTVFDSLSLIGQVQDMIMLPAAFTDTVIHRLAMLQAQIDLINAGILSTLLPSQKKLYENNMGALMCALCVTTSTGIDPTDYQTRIDVLAVISQVIDNYNTYLQTLCDLQTLTGGELDSYIPDPDALIALDNLVYFTINNLFTIANSAKQQRTYTLTEDSNVILVAFKLYGLLPDDSTITTLIANNNICGYELQKLNKGRELIYYV